MSWCTRNTIRCGQFTDRIPPGHRLSSGKHCAGGVGRKEHTRRDVAQLVAHYVRDVGVGRSSRLIPTRTEAGQSVSVLSFFLNEISHLCQKRCKFGTLQMEQDHNRLIFNRMAFKGIIEVDTQKCKGCSVCIANCPTQSIQLSKMVNSKGYHYAEMAGEGCIGCANCAAVCPDSVITVYRVKI